MKLIFLFLLVFACLFSACNSGVDSKNAIKKYKSVNDVFKESLEIEDRIEGFVNDDRLIDQIYVVRLLKSNKRHLVVMLRSDDDQFELFLNSAKIIRNVIDDVDPYIELKLENQQINIVQQDQGCLVEHSFDFHKKEKNYFLSKIDRKCDGLDNVRTANDFGTVKLVDFTIDKEY